MPISRGNLSFFNRFPRLIDTFWSFCRIMYFPEKGCHLGTNRSDNETYHVIVKRNNFALLHVT